MTGQRPTMPQGPSSQGGPQISAMQLRKAVCQVIENLSQLPSIEGYKIKVDAQDKTMKMSNFIVRPDNDKEIQGKSYRVSIEKDGAQTGVLDFQIAGDYLKAHRNPDGDRKDLFPFPKVEFSKVANPREFVQGLAQTAKQEIQQVINDITPM